MIEQHLIEKEPIIQCRKTETTISIEQEENYDAYLTSKAFFLMQYYSL